MNRRSFLGVILASAAAPAIARHDWLMRSRRPLIQTLSTQDLLLMRQRSLLESGDLFVALHTADPDGGLSEASYRGYARTRVPRTLSDLPIGTFELTYPECVGGNQTIVGCALVDRFGHAIAETRLWTNQVAVTTSTTLKLNLTIG